MVIDALVPLCKECGVQIGDDDMVTGLCAECLDKHAEEEEVTPDEMTSALRGALSSCLTQMEQCEKMFRGDEAFMAALSDARDALSLVTHRVRVVVTVEGGFIQGIVSDAPVEVMTIDYDIEGAEEGSTIPIPQEGPEVDPGYTENAFASQWVAEVMPERVAQLFAVRVGE